MPISLFTSPICVFTMRRSWRSRSADLRVHDGPKPALQALALWSTGVRRWVEKRGAGNVPKERAGVTINRRDLIALPIPSANLLWRDLHVREGVKENGKPKTKIPPPPPR
jgi:hypothetical protein